MEGKFMKGKILLLSLVVICLVLFGCAKYDYIDLDEVPDEGEAPVGDGEEEDDTGSVVEDILGNETDTTDTDDAGDESDETDLDDQDEADQGDNETETADLTEEDMTDDVNITDDDSADEDGTDEEGTSEDTGEEDFPTKTYIETDLVSINVQTDDPDDDDVQYSFSAPLNEDGSWQTEVGDAGEYVITITATDGELTTNQKVKIVVTPLNHPPMIESLEDIVVEETEGVEIEVEVSDEDGDEIVLSINSKKFEQDDTTFTWQTGYDDAGEYTFTVTASDGQADTEAEVTVVVENKNRPPVINDITFE